MSTERHKLECASRHHVTDKVTADINVAGELASNSIFGHRDTREIIFLDMCRGSLSISCFNSGLVYRTLGIAKAMEMFTKAYSIFLKGFGPDHPRTKMSKHNQS